MSFGEIRKGVELRARDPRREEIESWLANLLPRQFRGRILPIEEVVALEWGRMAAEGQKLGRVLPNVDGLLIATAAVHTMTLVTRNERDCTGRGVPVLNPWSADPNA
jgi:predicted nucleic acid-binding protein